MSNGAIKKIIDCYRDQQVGAQDSVCAAAASAAYVTSAEHADTVDDADRVNASNALTCALDTIKAQRSMLVDQAAAVRRFRREIDASIPVERRPAHPPEEQ